MDSNGNNQERLTHDLEEKGNPSWSPDGQWIVFDSYRNKVYHIYVVKTDGSGWSVSPVASFVTIWGEIKVPASVRR